MPNKPNFVPQWAAIVRYLRSPKTDWKPKIALVLAIAYLIVPIDFIPDVFPFFGWLDDLGIFTAVALWIIRQANQKELE